MRCPECGGETVGTTCLDLLHVLISLDFERRSPWAEHHAVSVSCFGLQHPGWAGTKADGAQWDIVSTFAAGTLDDVHRLTARRVADNNHRTAGPAERPPPPPSSGFPTTTIADVAVDGTFPADGFVDRLRAWARATVEIRS